MINLITCDVSKIPWKALFASALIDAAFVRSASVISSRGLISPTLGTVEAEVTDAVGDADRDASDALDEMSDIVVVLTGFDKIRSRPRLRRIPTSIRRNK